MKTFYTNESVVERIYSGADLMLPGVFKDGPFAENFADLCKGSACAVASFSGSPGSLQSSKALAVGLLEMSAADFKASGGKGVFVTVLHTARDRLTLEELATQPETVAACSPKKSSFCVEDFYFGPPVLEEVRIISSAAAPFFAAAGLVKGSAITQAETNQIVSAYVDSRKLRNSDNKSIIRADNLLLKVCEPNLLTEAPNSTLAQPLFQITYQDLITSLTRGLKVVYRLTFPPESGLQPFLTAGSKPPKLVLLETKVNGKDVTRISNLVTFGIDPKSFSRHLRTILACSVNVLDDTSHYTSAVQAQGAHAVRLSKLLTGEHNLFVPYLILLVFLHCGFLPPNKDI
ncbi:unnamed protein product [Dibothriocephalus latus]|uniref:SUI1 domain-containing protein n=1 Tax=Dibothriocephalus latus TaxID=60516 RepID=A0A3P6TXE3_DIBLA|nr:unnamed protein product [Dibothriocephalus latus]